MPYIKQANIKIILMEFIERLGSYRDSDETIHVGLHNDLLTFFDDHGITGNLNCLLFMQARKQYYNYIWMVDVLFDLAQDKCFCYKDFRDFMGELECAKREIERRMGKAHPYIKVIELVMDLIEVKLLAPYEDKKIKENGDIE